MFKKLVSCVHDSLLYADCNWANVGPVLPTTLADVNVNELNEYKLVGVVVGVGVYVGVTVFVGVNDGVIDAVGVTVDVFVGVGVLVGVVEGVAVGVGDGAI